MLYGYFIKSLVKVPATMDDDGLIDTQIGAFKEKKLFKRSSLF